MTMTTVQVIDQLATGPYGPENCGCSTVLECVTAASGGKVTWATPALQQGVILHMRTLVGRTQLPPVGIFLTQARDLVRSAIFAPLFKAAGLTAPKCHIVGDQATLVHGTLDDDSRVAYAHVWYPVIGNTRPDLAGQHDSIRFNHAIALQGLYVLPQGIDPTKASPAAYIRVHLDMANCDGTKGHRARRPGEQLYVRAADPLRDGRKVGGVQIGSGPCMWPLSMLRSALSQTRWTDAAGTTHQYGPGRCATVSIGVAQQLVVPETPEQAIARLTAERDAANAKNLALSAQLILLQEAADKVRGFLNDALDDLDAIAPDTGSLDVDSGSDPGTGVESGPPPATEASDQ